MRSLIVHDEIFLSNTGNGDYMEISQPLMFDPSDVPRMCTATIIISDNILESSEFFTITLSSPLQDSALIFPDPTANVTIIDTTCKYCLRCTYIQTV